MRIQTLQENFMTQVHDPLMVGMNNMQQNFQDNMGALSCLFETLSTQENYHEHDQNKHDLQNDFSQFTSIFDDFSEHFYSVYPLPPPGGQQVAPFMTS